MSAPGDLQSDLISRLIRHEGVRLKPYRDTDGKLTIGIGRNLTDVGVSMAEATMLLRNDINAAIAALDRDWPWWSGLGGARAQAMIELVFNMGPASLRQFKLFLAAMQAGNFDAAARDLLESAWAKQVGARAEALAAMIRTDLAN